MKLATTLLETLGYAHVKNVLHRDIKPENLFIEEHEGPLDGSKLKILDFGLSVALSEPGLRDKSGTPPYKAPECDKGLADQRSDIYSIGMVLYEMLSPIQWDVSADGRAVRKMAWPEIGQAGAVWHSTSGPRWLGNMLHGLFPSRFGTSAAQNCPVWLQAIISKATMPDPERRFQSAPEMLRAIVQGSRPSRRSIWQFVGEGMRWVWTNLLTLITCVVILYLTWFLLFLLLGFLSDRKVHWPPDPVTQTLKHWAKQLVKQPEPPSAAGSGASNKEPQ
jgi:serine/threonine protein kinase